MKTDDFFESASPYDRAMKTLEHVAIRANASLADFERIRKTVEEHHPSSRAELKQIEKDLRLAARGLRKLTIGF